MQPCAPSPIWGFHGGPHLINLPPAAKPKLVPTDFQALCTNKRTVVHSYLRGLDHGGWRVRKQEGRENWSCAGRKGREASLRPKWWLAVQEEGIN